MKQKRIDKPEPFILSPEKALATFKAGMSCGIQYELLAFLPWKSFFQNGSVFFLKAVFICCIKYFALWPNDNVRIYDNHYWMKVKILLYNFDESFLTYLIAQPSYKHLCYSRLSFYLSL